VPGGTATLQPSELSHSGPDSEGTSKKWEPSDTKFPKAQVAFCSEGSRESMDFFVLQKLLAKSTRLKNSKGHFQQ